MKHKISSLEKRRTLQYLLRTELLTSPAEVALNAGFSYERTNEILRALLAESLVSTGTLCHGYTISDNGTYEHQAGIGYKATARARKLLTGIWL